MSETYNHYNKYLYNNILLELDKCFRLYVRLIFVNKYEVLC